MVLEHLHDTLVRLNDETQDNVSDTSRVVMVVSSQQSGIWQTGYAVESIRGLGAP